MIVGLGMTAAPEMVHPDFGAAFAQGKSGERGNGGDRGRSGRDNDAGSEVSRGNSGNAGSVVSRGNSGNAGNRGNAGGGKGEDWVPPGQAGRANDATTAETVRGGKTKARGGKSNGHGGKADAELAEVDGVESELEETARGRGSIASALGALNAAHANENALANASPNSRVGRIAAYRDEVLNGQAAEEELEAAQALLDSLDEPDRSLRQIGGDLRDTQRDIRELREEIAAAEEGGATEEEIQALEDDLTELRETRRDLAEEFQEARTYRQAENAVEDLTEEVEASEILQGELLDAAANKEVTDEVVEEVNRLLGIEETEDPDDTEEVAGDVSGDGGADLLITEEN